MGLEFLEGGGPGQRVGLGEAATDAGHQPRLVVLVEGLCHLFRQRTDESAPLGRTGLRAVVVQRTVQIREPKISPTPPAGDRNAVPGRSLGGEALRI